MKTHPWMRELLEGGELIRYGAKAIPIGGLYAQPKLYVDGALLVGDAAGFCNATKLSGVHLAMKSGMLAAETIVDAIGAGRLQLGHARRLRRALPQELGLRGALGGPQLPRLLGAGLPVLLPERAGAHVPDATAAG